MYRYVCLRLLVYIRGLWQVTGHAIAQVVSRWLPTVSAYFIFQNKEHRLIISQNKESRLTKLEDSHFILQQDGAPPHFHVAVWARLNLHLSQRWIRHV
jgi:hypothetical protein